MHEALANQIVSAFESAVYPAGESVSVNTYDDEGTTEFFENTHWRDHRFVGLEDKVSCLTFLSPNALCFFIPSFMLAALANPESGFAAEVAVRLTPPKNDPSRPSYLIWWSQLQQQERVAVIAFLKFMQSEYGAIPGADLLTLEAYRVA